jgi:hypothetical protein
MSKWENGNFETTLVYLANSAKIAVDRVVESIFDVIPKFSHRVAVDHFWVFIWPKWNDTMVAFRLFVLKCDLDFCPRLGSLVICPQRALDCPVRTIAAFASDCHRKISSDQLQGKLGENDGRLVYV